MPNDIMSHAISVSQKKTTAPVPCKILLVGTHKDKLGDASQDPHDSNKKAKIESTVKQLLFGWLHQSKAFESIQVRNNVDMITCKNGENCAIPAMKEQLSTFVFAVYLNSRWRSYLATTVRSAPVVSLHNAI